MPETYQQYIRRRFREDGKPRSLEESRERMSQYAEEWSGRKQNGSENMAYNTPVREKKPQAVLRAAVTQTATNTYTETNVPTPVDAATNTAMRVHKIFWELERPNETDDATNSITAHLRTRGSGNISNISEAGTISQVTRVVDKEVDAAQGVNVEDVGVISGFQWDFGEQGILVVAPNLFLGITSAGQSAVRFARCMILYTLEKLSPGEYLAAYTTN